MKTTLLTTAALASLALGGLTAGCCPDGCCSGWDELLLEGAPLELEALEGATTVEIVIDYQEQFEGGARQTARLQLERVAERSWQVPEGQAAAINGCSVDAALSFRLIVDGEQEGEALTVEIDGFVDWEPVTAELWGGWLVELSPRSVWVT